MLLAIALLSLTGFDSSTVSLTVRAARLPLALETVGRATGHTLTVSPALQDEVLIVDVSAAPKTQLLKKVAELYDAQWEARKDGSLMLIPDADVRRNRRRLRASEAEDYLGKSLLALRNQLNRQPERPTREQLQTWASRKSQWTAAFAKSNSVTDRISTPRWNPKETPGWRAHARMLLSLSPRFFLRLAADRRVVFAETPTSIQRPFSSSMREIVARYQSEMAIFAPQVDYGTITFTVTRDSEAATFHSQFKAVDRLDGGADLQIERLFGNVPNPELPSELLRAPKGTLSEASSDLFDLLANATSASSTQIRVARDWTSTLKQPVANEPLQYLTSDALITLARAMKRNLVARPGEDMVLGSPDRLDFQLPSRIYKRFYDGLDLQSDEWMVYDTPILDHRPSRKLVQSFIQKSLQEGGVTLDAAANIADVEAGPDDARTWSSQWLQCLFKLSGTPDLMTATYNRTALRIWNAIGSENRQALRRGKAIIVSSLPAAAIEPIEHWIYDDPGDGWGVEEFRDGIRRGVLCLKIDEEPRFDPITRLSSSTSNSQSLNLNAFGKYLANAPRPDEVRFYMGRCTTYKLELYMKGAEEPIQLTASETIVPRSPRRLSDLPRSVRNQIEAAKRAAL